MEVSFLLQSFIGLVILLAILVFFLFFNPKKSKQSKKKTKVVPKRREDDYISLEKLLEIIKNRKSTAKELQNALDLVLKHHGTIQSKLGLRPHPDFDIYGEILLRICRHPNTTKEIILSFDRGLAQKNGDYKKDIDDFITKGLNSRGA